MKGYFVTFETCLTFTEYVMAENADDAYDIAKRHFDEGEIPPDQDIKDLSVITSTVQEGQ